MDDAIGNREIFAEAPFVAGLFFSKRVQMPFNSAPGRQPILVMYSVANKENQMSCVENLAAGRF